MTSTPQPNTPNWYPDPDGVGQLRWWDGQNWTDQVQDSLVPYEGTQPLGVLPPVPTPTPAPAWRVSCERFLVAHPVWSVVILLVGISLVFGTWLASLGSVLWIGGSVAALVWRESLKGKYPDAVPVKKMMVVQGPAINNQGTAVCPNCGSTSLKSYKIKDRRAQTRVQVTCLGCGLRRIM